VVVQIAKEDPSLDSNDLMCPFEILLSFLTPLFLMSRRFHYTLLLVVISSLVLTQFTTVGAYDSLYGVEYDDIIDVAFISYINGEFSNNYTADGAFRITVNPGVINANFIDEIIGMMIGEVKPYITWVDPVGNLVEYYDTTVVKLVKDSTPDTSKAWRIIRPILLSIIGIGVVIGSIYAGVKIRHRIGIRGCTNCSNKAASKCAKCGKHYCSNCSSTGCTNCGSRQFIRF
jgi:hypothetical protein